MVIAARNDEARVTKDEGMTKHRMTKIYMLSRHQDRILPSAMATIRHSSFVLNSSFVIRHSAFF
jgi:hypothetical protein